MPVKELRLNLRPLIKKLEIQTKKNTVGDLTGSYITTVKGRGLEFEGFRPYSINDDASQIDWKATLRSQETLVKKFVEERNLNVFFLFDVSNSMLFASTEKTKAEYGAEIIASLAFSILQAGDYTGLAMLNERIIKIVPLMNGTRHYYVIIKQLTNPEYYGGGFDLAYGLKFMIDSLKRSSIVVIVSDFLGLKGSWASLVTIASRKFDVMPIMVHDPNDTSLPSDIGQVVIKDPFSEEQILIDPTTVRQEFEKIAQQQIVEVREAFKSRQIPLLELYTDKPFVNPIINYFKHRVTR